MCNLSVGVYNEGRVEGAVDKAKKMALNLHKMGIADVNIAKAAEVSVETVRQWLKDKEI